MSISTSKQSILFSLLIFVFVSISYSQPDDRLVSWTPESGIKFDGQTQYIRVEDGDAFNLPELTLEAWVKFDDLSGNQIFLNRGEPSTNFTFYAYSGEIRMLVQDQSGYSHAHASLPPAGQWFHCVGTFNRQGEKKLYYNGQLVNKYTPSSSSNYRPIQSDEPLLIGALKETLLGTLERPFDGEMENIRVWNRELSSTEIRALLETQPQDENIDQLKEDGLIAYWAKRSVEGDTVDDLTGNGHTGEWIEIEDKPVVIGAPRADGYHGIWYSNQRSDDKYRYKYSGGLGTYCAKHRHHAQYAPEVDRTFFVYGGTKGVNEPQPLLIMISYYDHKTGTVPKPAIVMEKGTGDAHHNPTLSIDQDGHLWVFASAHGGSDGFIWKSAEPYSIDEFELVMRREFTYPQPRYVEGFGFVFLFTKYTAGRECYVSFSPDGYEWTPDKKIAGFDGHYQISSQSGQKRGTALNWHPSGTGVNSRTNLYYLETRDFGQTWTNVEGDELELPLSSPQNDALVHDYQNDGDLVYLKDITYDHDDNPVILVILSKGYESGPENGPRIWSIAHWSGSEWQFKKVTESDHNYDMGSLYIEEDGTWRIIAPTENGPQEYCTGGEVAIWISEDQGNTWRMSRQLTSESELNHTYVRRVLNANPEFYAFWADGNALEPSESSLYFCNKDGSKVWMLPREIKTDTTKPILLSKSKVQNRFDR